MTLSEVKYMELDLEEISELVQGLNKKSLLGILLKNGIAIFKEESVEKYKKSKESLSFDLGSFGVFLYLLFPILSLLGLIVSGIIPPLAGTILGYYCLWIFGGTLVFSTIAIIIFLGFEINPPFFTHVRDHTHWTSRHFQDYAGYIPMEAKTKAVIVQKLLVQELGVYSNTTALAYLSIEYLTTESYAPDLERVRAQEQKRKNLEELLADPFLVVKYGEEKYYIAAWDEPNFVKKLL